MSAQTPPPSDSPSGTSPDISPSSEDSFAHRLGRARFRSWHRGTREADFMIGGFFDRYGSEWGADELAWFEALLEEDDVDIMAWAMGTAAVPERFDGALMTQMKKLDYVDI